MGRWLLGIVLILIGATAYALIMGPKFSENMGDDIRLALNSNGSGWADVKMDGHIATVTGQAPSSDAARGAILTAQNTVCSDCKADEPWHRVLNGTETIEIKVVEAVKSPSLPLQSPYTFSVLKSRTGTVTLDGYVTSSEEREALLVKARSTFSGDVQNETIQMASGEPNDEWLTLIQAGMEELAFMESGRFQVEDNNFLINGEAKSADIRERINEFSDFMSGRYDGAANVNVPNLASDAVGQVNSQSICQALFNDLNQGRKIKFSSGQSEITGNDSFDLLAEIAAAANQCQDFQIQIDGYTDNVGNEESNQQLSEQRANRVLAYLTQQGVDRNRMTATGHGEADPIGNNATTEGQEMNRRTTFTLIQAQ